MLDLTEQGYENFEKSVIEFIASSELTKLQKGAAIASQIDQLSRSRQGIELLYDKSLELESAGIFNDSVWQYPEKQVPNLVKGTLLSGHPNSSFEILSELRLLAYSLGKKGSSNITREEATSFLEEAIVHNLEFAYDELTEESRLNITPQERKKIVNHFKFLLEKAELEGIKEKLADEITKVCAQRPIVTQNVRNLIQTVYQKIELDGYTEVDNKLNYFVNALYYPAPLVQSSPIYENYYDALQQAGRSALEEEARSIGKYLHETGLTNPYQAILLRYLIYEDPELVNDLLHLNNKGKSEWERYRDFAGDMALYIFNEHNYRGIYGFKRMLEKSLFSRNAVRSGLTNLKLISVHPHVEKRILRSVVKPSIDVTAKQYLMGALIAVLGQPTGVSQGNNPSCQSARGISMWAQHSPAKLIDMITTVTSANNLIIRFEQNELESLKLGKGLVDKLDYNLDAVSVVLVPHLDKIYNEMMNRASNRGEDPHKWTNPAFYGHFVPIGFASPYNYLTNSIYDFKGFVKLFYSSFHPLYNGGHEMVYPNPVGIFITSSKGDMLGFHAVSLLRVALNESTDEYRAYFLNPNNEGRQDWGQGIRPSVYEHGEHYGESSLPVHQFAARVYAFHYDNLNVGINDSPVPSGEIEKVEKLAKESWGKSYQWVD